MNAYEEGYKVYSDFIEGLITTAGIGNPYCIEDPRSRQFSEGFLAGHEAHQVAIN